MKNKLFSTFLSSLLAIVLLSGLISCGGPRASLSAADRAFEAKKYYTAADFYRKSSGQAKTREERGFVIYKVGECYRMMNDHKNAEKWYERSMRSGFDSSIAYLKIAESQKTLEKFDDAIENLDKYLELVPNNPEALKALESTKLAKEYMEKPRYYEIYNENTLNSRNSEFAPFYFRDGILFTSTREPVKGKNLYEWTGSGYLNIYSSSLSDRGRWSKPELLTKKTINTPYNEGVASFDEQNKILYFTQCNGKKGKDEECRIYASKATGEDWSNPVAQKIGPDSFTVGHPSISADGNWMIFSGRLPDSYGESDLYYTEKVSDSVWSEPKNLGPSINTIESEVFPFIHKDGTLYFSSNGHVGMGGLDIFSAREKDGEWELWENMKWPVNTTADDFSFILDDDKMEGYLASNRVGGRGDDDIYAAVFMLLDFKVTGTVYNQINKSIIPKAKITLSTSGAETKEVETDEFGKYSFILEGDKDYTMTATKKNHFGDKGSVSTQGLRESEDFVVDFNLEPIPTKEIVLQGILYDLNSAELRAESKNNLDSLIKTLEENPTLRIELAAHTDSRADSAYNQDLSQRRAQSVLDYLVLNGIKTDRLQAKGYGESQLLNKCSDGVECTEEQHQINRRTTFRVIAEDIEIESETEESPLKQKYKIR